MLSDKQLTALRNRFRREADSLLLQEEEEESGGGELAEKSQEERKKDAAAATRRPLPRVNRHSVFWILAAVAVTYRADFVGVLLHGEAVRRWWLAAGLALLAICLCLGTFCVVYLEWFRGVRHYEREYPAVLPVTTAAFVAAAFSLNVALWPVWRLLTPLIMSTQGMGLLMLLTLLG